MARRRRPPPRSFDVLCVLKGSASLHNPVLKLAWSQNNRKRQRRRKRSYLRFNLVKILRVYQMWPSISRYLYWRVATFPESPKKSLMFGCSRTERNIGIWTTLAKTMDNDVFWSCDMPLVTSRVQRLQSPARYCWRSWLRIVLPQTQRTWLHSAHQIGKSIA